MTKRHEVLDAELIKKDLIGLSKTEAIEWESEKKGN